MQYGGGDHQHADLNRRAGWSLGLGIGSIVTVFFCFVLSPILGIVALVMGRKVNTEARALGMSDLGNAKAGWICGLIGLVLSGLFIAFFVLAVGRGGWMGT
jgi:hypothetical protein